MGVGGLEQGTAALPGQLLQTESNLPGKRDPDGPRGIGVKPPQEYEQCSVGAGETVLVWGTPIEPPAVQGGYNEGGVRPMMISATAEDKADADWRSLGGGTQSANHSAKGMEMLGTQPSSQGGSDSGGANPYKKFSSENYWPTPPS